MVLHRTTKFDPYPIESRLLRNPNIQQAALIGHRGTAVLFLRTTYRDTELMSLLLETLKQEEQDFGIVVASSLPVDGRHNSKIDRPTLRKWLQYSWWYKRTRYRELKR